MKQLFLIINSPKMTVQIIMLMLFINNGFAQIFKQWDKTIGGSSYDYARCVLEANNGGYIVAGYSVSSAGFEKSQNSLGGYDYWIVKLSSSGTKIWDKTFGGSSNDYLNAGIKTFDGGYLFVGESYSDVSGDKTGYCRGNADFWIIKLDANGNLEWEKTYGGADWDGAYAVKQIPIDGGYIIAGSSLSGRSGDKTHPSKGSGDYWIIRLDSNGNMLWDKTIGGSAWDGAYAIEIANDGGYIVLGDSSSDISGDKTDYHRGEGDYWIVKISTNGTVLWDKTFGGSKFEYSSAIIQASTNGYIVVGSSQSGLENDKTEQGYGYDDYWIIKIDNNGNKIWDKVFGGTFSDKSYSITKMANSYYMICGYSWSDASGNKTENRYGYCDYWTIKIDEQGNKLWDKTIGGTNWDLGSSIAATMDNGYIIVGDSWSDSSGMKTESIRGECDWWIVKFIGLLNPPQIVVASKGNYTNKVSIYWSAVAGAAGYEIWRATEDSPSAASKIATTTLTNYDDNTLSANVTYYYFVKATNAAGASDFSASDYGYKGFVGPAIFINNKVGTVKVSSALNTTIALRMMNLTQYLGVPVDWWCVAYSRNAGVWYYFNNALQPVAFSGVLSECLPLYQGALMNTPLVPLYNGKLPQGTYDLWFGVEYPLDGILSLSEYMMYIHSVIVAE